MIVRVRLIITISSVQLTVRILPQRTAKASVLGPSISPINKSPKPSIKENITPTTVSGFKSPLSASGPTNMAVNKLKTSAKSKGFTPKRRPRIAPVKAE